MADYIRKDLIDDLNKTLLKEDKGDRPQHRQVDALKYLNAEITDYLNNNEESKRDREELLLLAFHIRNFIKNDVKIES